MRAGGRASGGVDDCLGADSTVNMDRTDNLCNGVGGDVRVMTVGERPSARVRKLWEASRRGRGGHRGESAEASLQARQERLEGRASERPDTGQANARERDGWCVLLEVAEALESLAYAQEPRPKRRRAVGPSLVCSAVLSARRFFFFRTGVARVSCLRRVASRWIFEVDTC